MPHVSFSSWLASECASELASRLASGLASVHAFELAPIERRAHQEQRRPVHAELRRQPVHVRPVYVEYVAPLYCLVCATPVQPHAQARHREEARPSPRSRACCSPSAPLLAHARPRACVAPNSGSSIVECPSTLLPSRHALHVHVHTYIVECPCADPYAAAPYPTMQNGMHCIWGGDMPLPHRTIQVGAPLGAYPLREHCRLHPTDHSGEAYSLTPTLVSGGTLRGVRVEEHGTPTHSRAACGEAYSSTPSNGGGRLGA